MKPAGRIHTNNECTTNDSFDVPPANTLELLANAGRPRARLQSVLTMAANDYRGNQDILNRYSFRLGLLTSPFTAKPPSLRQVRQDKNTKANLSTTFLWRLGGDPRVALTSVLTNPVT